MEPLPEFDSPFLYENNFYLSCDSSRLAKAIGQFKLFEKTKNVEGDIFEFGVFKGASFSRFSMYRKILNMENKKLIGFDTFKFFPETNYEQDKFHRKDFIDVDGNRSISKKQLFNVLRNKKTHHNVELVEGNILETLPEYIQANNNMRISFINLDVDVYEPTVLILEKMFPKLSPGCVIALDNYLEFPGETDAVNEFVTREGLTIEEPLFPNTPFYIEM